MAASRITVEVAGDSLSLQRAVAKAADSLKGLGDVLARQTGLAADASDRTIRMNELVARSYQGAARTAMASTREATVSYTASVDKQVADSQRAIVAQERQAAASERLAQQQTRANDMAAASAQRSAARQAESAAKTGTAFGAANSQLTRAGKTTTLGLLGIAAASVYMGAKFQANTLRMQTQAGATATQLDKIRKGLVAMAPIVAYTPDQLATGMYHVVSSMNAVLPPLHRTSEELQIMKVAAEGAQVGHANLEDTTYALASALNALGLRGNDAQHVMGELNAIVGSGDMTMQQLLDTFKSGLIPGAKSAGLSLQSLGAALAVMGDKGMQGALAGTRLRMSIALLSAPAKQAAGILTTLGLSSQQALSTSDAMSKALQQAGLTTTRLGEDLRKPDGLTVALQDLNDHLRASGLTASGAAAVMNKAFGGGRMGATITLLAQSTDRLRLKFNQIGDSANQFQGDWQKTSQSTAVQMKRMEANAAALATRLGTDLLPYVQAGIRDLNDFVGWLEKGGTAAHALEIGIGTLATVAIGSFFASQVKKAIVLVKDLRAVVALPFKFAGAQGLAARIAGTSGAGMGISGIHGPGLAGSETNPLAVIPIGGGLMPGGGATAAAGETAAAGAGGAAERDIMGSIKSGFGTVLKGLGIAGIGVAGAQLGGQAIGGTAGHLVSTIGTGAAAGAGIGSIIFPGGGTIAGAVAGGLIAGAADFIQNDANKYGNQIADRLTAQLPANVRDRVQKPLADAFNKAHSTTPGNLPFEAPGANDTQKARAAWAAAGHDAGAAWVLGIQHVKFPSTLSVFESMDQQLKAMDPKARNAAASTMLQYASTLEKQGVLPKGAVEKLIQTLEAQFPGLTTYLTQQGTVTARDFANTMQMNQAVSNTQQLVATLRGDFGHIFDNAKTTTGNMLDQVTHDYQTLKDNVSQSTGAAKQAGIQAMAQLKQQATQDASAMATNVGDKMQNMHQTVANASSSMATQASNSFMGFAHSVANAMSAGTVATSKGMSLIGQALNTELKALGAKTLPTVVLNSLSPQSLLGEAKFLNQGSPSLASGGKGHRAGGGYIGQPGQKGADTVPIMAGLGEAVLNRQQQAIVNHALMRQGIPGLSAVFAGTAGAKHYMAQGGYAGGGLVDPIQGFSLGRTDQGVDASAAVGTPIRAIADSRLAYTIQGWWAGQPLIEYQITDGPYAGRYWYAAEQITPVTEKPGAFFRAGQAVGHYAPTGTSLEIGWGASLAASHGTGTLAGATTGYTEGQVTPAGASFLHLAVEGGTGGGIPGGGGVPVKTITAPHVHGDGVIATIAQAAIDKATAAANAKIQKAGAMLGGVGGSVPLVGNEGNVMAEIGRILLAKGFNRIGASGILGNAYGESGLNPAAIGSGGGGLWGFTAGDISLASLQAYAAQHHAPWTNVALQTQFLLYGPQPAIRLMAGLNAQRTPQAASDYFMNEWEHPGIPRSSVREGAAAAAYRAGFAPGGFVDSMDRTKHTGAHAAAASGIPRVVPSLARSASVKPPGATTPRRGSHKQSKGTRLPALPKLKQLPGFAPDLMAAIASDNTTTTELGNWLGYLQSLHGVHQVEATLTDAAGNTTINWGSPGAALGALTGKIDPTTGQRTKSIWDRLREIGQPGGVDRNTELGVDDLILTALQHEQLHAGSAVKEFLPWLNNMNATVGFETEAIGWLSHVLNPQSPWDSIKEKDLAKILTGKVRALKPLPKLLPGTEMLMPTGRDRFITMSLAKYVVDKAREVKNMQAQIERWDHLKQQLPGQKAARDTALTKRFAAARTKISTSASATTVNASQLLRDQQAALEKERRDALAGITSTKPKGWKGDPQAWSKEHSQERAAVEDEFNTRRTALEKHARAAGLSGQIHRARARAALSSEETTERAALEASYRHRDHDLSNLITGDTRVKSGDTRYLGGILSQVKSLNTKDTAAVTAATQSGGFRDQLKAYLDPMGDLSIAIATKKNIDIAGLLGEIGALKGTTVPPAAGTSSDVLALQQQLTDQAAELNAAVQAQSKVLIGFLPMLQATVGVPQYAEGGPVLRDGLIYAHEGEHVVPRQGALVSHGPGSTATTVELHQHFDGRAGELQRFIDQRIAHPDNVRVVSRQIGMRTSLLRR